MDDIATYVLNIAKEVGSFLIGLPLKVWNSIPATGHYIVYAFIIGVMIFLMVFLIKNKRQILNHLY